MRADRELIHEYLEGSEEAFRTFYWRHRQALFVYIVSIVHRRELAEEILQGTLVTFLRHLERLDDRSNYRPWLLRVARSRCIDALRGEERHGRALKVHGERLRERRTGEGTHDLHGLGLSEEVARLLLDLPSEQREVLVLRGCLELTFAEIAEMTGVPENTAISRHRYGMARVRRSLGRAESPSEVKKHGRER